MKNLEILAKKDNRVMSLLKLDEVRHVLLESDKGTLSLKLAKGGASFDYVFVLDAIPVESKYFKELFSLLEPSISKLV